MKLVSTFVGKTKDQADEVDSDLVVSEVCNTFGQFVKFYVEDRIDDITNSVGYSYLLIF